MNYIPLNVKTEYELLSSYIKIDNLCKYLNSNKINYACITDSNMFGSLEFINTCKKYGIKPIIGVSFSYCECNIILYAKNYNGYVNLLNLVSFRNMGTLKNDDFINKSRDLICVTDNYKYFDKLSEIYLDVYLSYSTKDEKNTCLEYTTNVVYMKESRCIFESEIEYLIYLQMIKDGKTISNIGEYSMCNYIDCDIIKEDALTTFEFSSKINLQLPSYKFDLPKYTTNSFEFLKNLCYKGITKRLNNNVELSYLDRLNMELDVINSMGYCDYFLIVYDFILYAKKNGIIVGPGRGSAAGSLVSYSLGITEVDPIKYDLIFERFLNKDRVSMPDIDTDVDYLRRDEVINYIKNKYGIDKVASIITFGTLLPKQVIRDVSRVLEINSNNVEEITKTIINESNFTELKSNAKFMSIYNSDKQIKNLINICSKLVGFKRHTSIHAAGVIVSSDSLYNKVPIYLSGEEKLCGYTKEYLESLGLLKIDILSLKNLTIIDEVVRKIKKEKNINIDINKIPLDDKLTLNVFSNVYTTGIFQFESEGMKSFLKMLKVEDFNDLVSAIALYRPGPKDMIPEYIKVKNKKGKPNYVVSELESILKSTNGIIIYQEQIMEILKTVASFTYSEADNIRRAMSKKKEEVILSYQKDFIDRAVKNGYKESDAFKIYELILKFASYGFNKSHSVAYSIIAYDMAYLKAHYPYEFMSTLLDMVTDNVVKTKYYISESKIFDLKFKKCDINISNTYYLLNNNEVYMPFNLVKSLNKSTINKIISQRTTFYKDYFDFIVRMYKIGVDNKSIECLILSSCLDSFGLSKKTMIMNMNMVLEYAKVSSLLGDDIEKPVLTMYEEYTNNECDNFDLKYYGFYVSNHPTCKYVKDSDIPLNKAKEYFDKVIDAVGVVESIRVINTKKNEVMAFLTLSDEEGKIKVTVFPKVYKEYNCFNESDVIRVRGRVEKRFSEYQIILVSAVNLSKDN